MPARRARLADAGADEESGAARLEAVGIAERGELPPGSDERFLDGVLRQVGVSQDQPGGRIEPVDRGGRERGEGVMIAPSRPFHELPLHLDPRQPARTVWPRSEVQYGEASRRFVPSGRT